MWRDGQDCYEAALFVAGGLAVLAEMPLLALDLPRWSTLYPSGLLYAAPLLMSEEYRCPDSASSRSNPETKFLR
jgi:hypothetical protein